MVRYSELYALDELQPQTIIMPDFKMACFAFAHFFCGVVILFLQFWHKSVIKLYLHGAIWRHPGSQCGCIIPVHLLVKVDVTPCLHPTFGKVAHWPVPAPRERVCKPKHGITLYMQAHLAIFSYCKFFYLGTQQQYATTS